MESRKVSKFDFFVAKMEILVENQHFGFKKVLVVDLELTTGTFHFEKVKVLSNFTTKDRKNMI